ncbi:hypothetical protein V5O48_005501 [Marasmius crinis-equi]|uniref:Uncharacterized protein n=1 Tax=Marasmius crinis-equi TaxID=585013 RepID=A0ABR3FM53_9AGAR
MRYGRDVEVSSKALSAMLMAGAAIVTITAWSQVMQLNAHPIPLNDEAALFFHSILFTVLAVLGLIGFCAGSFVLSVIFRGNPPDVVERCRRGAKDDLTTVVCTNGVAIQKSVAVIVYLTSWGLEGYAILIIYGFQRHLTQASKALDFSSPPDHDRSPVPLKPSPFANPSINITAISQPSPGVNVGYAFSTVEPEFGDVANRPMRTPKTAGYRV